MISRPGWRSKERYRHDHQRCDRDVLEKAYLQRLRSQALPAHHDDVDGIAERRTQDGEGPDQHALAKLRPRLPAHDHQHPGESEHGRCDTPAPNALAERQGGKEQRDQGRDECQCDRLGHRNPGQAKKEQQAHDGHHGAPQNMKLDDLERRPSSSPRKIEDRRETDADQGTPYAGGVQADGEHQSLHHGIHHGQHGYRRKCDCKG